MKCMRANYSSGRVFCMGDAVHRHPPTNGLGSNTSIQDAYNLCWKLKLVLESKASPALLDSYYSGTSAGRQANRDPRQQKSSPTSAPIFEAARPVIVHRSGADEEKHGGAQGANREGKARRRSSGSDRAQELRVQLPRRRDEPTLRVDAVVSDGTPEPAFARDRELYYQATTWPGAHLPHVWVEHHGIRKSTLDLAGKGRFTLLTGIGGECWSAAAAAVEANYGLPVDVVSIGPAGSDAQDIYADWYRQCEVEEDGCVVVRPDMYVAWRAKQAVANASDVLIGVFGQLLGRTIDTDRSEASVAAA